MFCQQRVALAVVALLLCQSGVSQAAVVLGFSEDRSSVFLPSAGGTTQFTVEAQIATDSGIQPMFGYSLPIDVAAPAGKGLPTGWSILSVTPVFNFPGTNFSQGLNNATVDIYPEDLTFTGVGENLTTTPLDLFNINFQINDQAVAGDYSVTYLDLPITSIAVNGTGGELPRNEISFGTTTVELTVVPEPSACTFGLPLLLACVARRRRVSNFVNE